MTVCASGDSRAIKPYGEAAGVPVEVCPPSTGADGRAGSAGAARTLPIDPPNLHPTPA